MDEDTVLIESHSEALQLLNDQFDLIPSRTAIVTIDMHRGHLDPVHATMPVSDEDRERVVDSTGRLLEIARGCSIPVVHVILTLRPVESERIRSRFVPSRMVLSNEAPLTEARREGVPHNIEGSIQTELVPELGPAEGDYVIDNKKTASAFVGTDLDNLLQTLGVKTVVAVGINTNTCVQCSAFDAVNLGYDVVVVSDCVASMYGNDLHVLGLENIRRCIGWVLSLDEFERKVQQAEPVARSETNFARATRGSA